MDEKYEAVEKLIVGVGTDNKVRIQLTDSVWVDINKDVTKWLINRLNSMLNYLEYGDKKNI